MEYLYPLIATDRDGKTELFYDADSFREFALHRCAKVGGRWAVTEYRWSNTVVVENDWIVRDDRGRPVDIDDFRVTKYYYRHNKYNFRDGPVENIGHNRAGWKQNATAKKNGGSGASARRASKVRYENKVYGLKDIRSERYSNPWLT